MNKSAIDIARKAGFAMENSAAIQAAETFAAAIKAAHLAELAGVDMPKPVAHIAWRNGKPNYEGDDAICEDAVWPVDSDDDRESKAVVTLDQCREAVASAVARKNSEWRKQYELQAVKDSLTTDAERYRAIREGIEVESNNIGIVISLIDDFGGETLRGEIADATIDAALEVTK